MPTESQSRTRLLLGDEGLARLQKAHVLLFGLGGVGSYTAEALARAGVGALTIVDDDMVSESNLNRQLIALHSTLGQPKAAVEAARIADIAPGCLVTPVRLFYGPDTAAQLPFARPGQRAGIPFGGYDYIIDAVDTVTAKLEILQNAAAAGIPAISCMGTGNKLHPELLQVTTLEKTQGCPLARVMRRECRKRGLKNVRVVYSTEPPIPPRADGGAGEGALPKQGGASVAACASAPGTPAASKSPAQGPFAPGTPAAGKSPASGPFAPVLPAAGKSPAPARPGRPKTVVPGSVSFVPGAAGLLLAAEVVRALAGVD